MSNEEVIELSVDETNALRIQLGLAPLRTCKNEESEERQKTHKADIHLPAPDTAKEEETKSRINEIKLAREIKKNLKKNFAQSSLAVSNTADSHDDNSDILSWAERMRRKTSKVKSDVKNENQSQGENTYTSQDLQGMKVAHSVSLFQTNKETILTLADESILQQNENKITTGLNENHESRLENIEISGSTKAKENLRKRRRIEMGQGHAGGYAAWDDEEFDEMGGISSTNLDIEDDNTGKTSSFIIGNSDNLEKDQKDQKESFFGPKVKISLESSNNENKLATDFLTVEEYEEQKQSKKKKKSKKEKGFKKLKKKKKKEEKNKHRRKKLEDESSDEDNNTEKKKKLSLLEDLVSSAVDVSHVRRARRRNEEEHDKSREHLSDQNKSEIKNIDIVSSSGTVETSNEVDDEVKNMQAKRAKFDAVMEKGNIRSKQAFHDTDTPLAKTNSESVAKSSSHSATRSVVKEENVEDETDDAFLNAALAKARRLQKLKKLVKKNKNDMNQDVNMTKGDDEKAKAILDVLESSKGSEHVGNQNRDMSSKNNESKETGVTFEFDPTREFTRALRARATQNQRQMKIKLKSSHTASNTISKQEKSENKMEPSVATNGDNMEEEELTKLAQEISDESTEKNQSSTDTDGLNFTSHSNLLVNRGLSSTLSLLKTTGSLASYDTKNSSLQEKLRGRAKDYRNYEDYESLNLSKVTSIGSSRDVKDKEFTKREVKLEYRDEFGRLLTSKEAYRQMCYQFHGHGSGKKNEERRMKLIERERMEVGGGSAAGGGVVKREGTLGALKATQRVTGKAFIVHKT